MDAGEQVAAPRGLLAAQPPPGAVPPGYADVDPRTARRVALTQPLDAAAPLFPGDPPLAWEPWASLATAGYAVERVVLGSHTGTHVSAPAHMVAGGADLAALGEALALLPLVVVDARDRGAGTLGVADLRGWEDRHGPLPPGACVLLLTGQALRWGRPGGPRYGEGAPGFSAEAAGWLVDRRAARVVGADSFGPDAAADEAFSASRAVLGAGAATLENVGPGLAAMRPRGDWVAVNGPRPPLSGFPVGVTGFTLPG